MFIPDVERIAGVCALVPNPLQPTKEFLAIREQTWKRTTNKLPGMLTAPFETVETGENHTDALKRIFTEEYRIYQGQLSIPEDRRSLDGALLCKVQLSPGAYLYAYQVPAAEDFIGIVGDRQNEINNIGWVSFDRVIDKSKKWFEFRPGMDEIVNSYFQKLSNPEEFYPETYLQTCISISPQLFDLLEDLDFGKETYVGIESLRIGTTYIERIYKAMECIGMDSKPYKNRIRRQLLIDLFDS